MICVLHEWLLFLFAQWLMSLKIGSCRWYEEHSFCEWAAAHRSETKNVDWISQFVLPLLQWHDYFDNYFKRWACWYRCTRDVCCRRDRLVWLYDKLETYVRVIKMIVSTIHLVYFSSSSPSSSSSLPWMRRQKERNGCLSRDDEKDEHYWLCTAATQEISGLAVCPSLSCRFFRVEKKEREA